MKKVRICFILVFVSINLHANDLKDALNRFSNMGESTVVCSEEASDSSRDRYNTFITSCQNKGSLSISKRKTVTYLQILVKEKDCIKAEKKLREARNIDMLFEDGIDHLEVSVQLRASIKYLRQNHIARDLDLMRKLDFERIAIYEIDEALEGFWDDTIRDLPLIGDVIKDTEDRKREYDEYDAAKPTPRPKPTPTPTPSPRPGPHGDE